MAVKLTTCIGCIASGVLRACAVPDWKTKRAAHLASALHEPTSLPRTVFVQQRNGGAPLFEQKSASPPLSTAMEQSPEEVPKQPSCGQPAKLPPEPPTKPSSPGILKSPPSLFQPVKEPSTKTLRFKIDQPVQSQPAAPLASPTPALQTPASDSGAQLVQHAAPNQYQPEENKDVRGKAEMSSTMSENTQESLSESSSSGTLSSLFDSSISLDSPEWLVSQKKKRAAPVSPATVVIAPTTHMVRRLGGRRMVLASWFPDGILRLLASRNDRDKSRGGTPRHRTQESRDSEQGDESSPAPLFEDLPWRSSLPLQTLMGLLGGLALVFVISLMIRESRRGGGGNIESRQLEEAVTIGAEDPDEDRKSVSLPQMTLSDIEEPPQVSAGIVQATEWTGVDTGCSALHSETAARATRLSATSATLAQSTVGASLQEVFGKVRQMRSDTLHASRRAKRRRACSPSVFTYCRATQPEFYYDNTTGDCVATRKLIQLCNRGPNRFPSADSCRLRCVETQRPDKHCFRPVSAVQCSRQDHTDVTRWYFDGKRCRRWLSRPDRCPSHGGQLFTTAQECRSNCAAANASQCRAPNATACDLGLYFAHRTRQTMPFRCISTAAMTTGRKGRACLMGANRFATMQACRNACVPTSR